MHESYSLYISDDLYSLPAILLASVFLFYCPLWSSKNISRLCHLPAPSLSLNITSTEKLCLPSNYFRKLSNLLNNIQVNSWVWLYSGLWLLKQRFKSQATLIPRWNDSQNCISHPEGSYKSQICLSNYWMDTPIWMWLLQINMYKPELIIFPTILNFLLSVNNTTIHLSIEPKTWAPSLTPSLLHQSLLSPLKYCLIISYRSLKAVMLFPFIILPIPLKTSLPLIEILKLPPGWSPSSSLAYSNAFSRQQLKGSY